jgi:GntR family negative regulator for fad regulon and positive regulator of fabA
MGGEMDWRLVFHVLQVRADIAPSYASQAVSRNPDRMRTLLEKSKQLPETAQAFAQYDWQLHHGMTVLSENPIYPLILNGFEPLYERLAVKYFVNPEERELSKTFYAGLLDAVDANDPIHARDVTLDVMQESKRLMQIRSEEL